MADMCGGNHFMSEAKRAAQQSTAIEIRQSTCARVIVVLVMVMVRVWVRVRVGAGARARARARAKRLGLKG
jgi:hypothetical protein